MLKIKKIPDDFNKLEVNGNIIKRVVSTKYLGLIIDEKLSWNEHTTYVYNSLLKYYGIFNRIKYFVNKNVVRQLYFAFIYSRIKYGIEVYGSCANCQIHKLQVIQSGLLKMLLKFDRRTDTNYLHKYMRILKVSDIYRQQLICFHGNNIRRKLPIIFNNYFGIINTNYNFRNPALDIDFGRTNYGLLTVKNSTLRLWHSLPNELKDKASQLNFRKHIATHFMN